MDIAAPNTRPASDPGAPPPVTRNPEASPPETTALNTAAAPKIAADFDTFLSLLTAQLENQDPLKPVDSTEFVAQLAQFSAVEQQVQSKTVLESILGKIGGTDISQVASWLGAGIATGGLTPFAGTPVTLSLPLNDTATSSTIAISDEAGTIVARVAVDTGAEAGAETFVWSGENDEGAPVPEGRYRFVLESMSGTTALPDSPVTAFTEVREARLIDGTMHFVLPDRSLVAITDVTAVRQPATSTP